MSLKEIAAACGGTYHGDPALLSKEASSVTIDSRKVQKDTLFVAIKGARVGGHSFYPQVMEQGAICSLSEQDLGDVTYPYIQVASCTDALKDLAEHYRHSLDIKVVGISGSVGKTSTKEMIASVLSEKYCVLKTEGNFNNEIGLPLTVFNLREEHEVAVLEMGSVISAIWNLLPGLHARMSRDHKYRICSSRKSRNKGWYFKRKDVHVRFHES